MKLVPEGILGPVFPAERANVQPDKPERDEQVLPVEKTNEAEMPADGGEIRSGTDRETGRPAVRTVDRPTEDVVDDVPRGSFNPWQPNK